MCTCSSVCTCLHVYEARSASIASSITLHLISWEHLPLTLRLTDSADLAKLGALGIFLCLPPSTEDYRPATTSDFLYGRWRPEPAFQSNKSVNRKSRRQVHG